jgi:ABC-type lipoprotein export system ATPase subunit
LIRLKNVQKTYCTKNGVTFRALNNVSLSFDSTGLVYLVGASGSGKSTLLNVIGGLDAYDSGEVVIAGKKLNAMKSGEVDSLRNNIMGFVFQEFNLIDTLSVYDNVQLALDMQSGKDDGAVMRVLEEMGIADKAKSKTKDLSGGQRQRVSIARALVKNPRLILADEPTGSLDSATSAEVTGILKKLSETRLVIVVTHDMDTAIKTGDRIIEMKDGKIYRDVRKKKEGEVIEKVNAQMYSDTLMVVPENAQVNDADVEKINNALSRSVRKTYVTVESDGRKVKALFPNLREAVTEAGAEKSVQTKSRKEESEDAKLSSDEFVPFSEAEGEMEKTEFKKSRLSFVRSVKLAFNNLNYKKVRLVLTVIVAFLAFVLFGVSQSFANYDLRTAVSKTLEKENITRTAIAPSSINAYYYGDVGDYNEGQTIKRISANEFKRLEERLPSAKFSRQYDVYFDRLSIDYTWTECLENFKGIVEIDDVSDCDYTLICGKSSCENFDEVIISEYAARSLIRSRLYNVREIEALIGKTLRLSLGGEEYAYEIAGIFECENAERWIDGDKKLYDAMGTSGLSILQARGWGQLYTKKGFAEDFYKRLAEKGMVLSVRFESGAGADLSGEAGIVFGGVKTIEGIVPIIGSGAIEREGDVIVEAQTLFSIFGEIPTEDENKIRELAERLNADTDKKIAVRDKKIGAIYVSDDLRVVGVTNDKTGVVMYMSDAVKEKVTASYMLSAVVNVNFSAADSRALTSAIAEFELQLLEPFMVSYDTAEMVLEILHWVLLVVSLIFCLLVVILLFTFISTSIKITRKHIGILRALGAKKADTFMIYALEGVLVTLCSLVIAVLVIAIGAPILNTIIGAASGYYFALITVTAPVYVTMVAVATVVTLLSVFIPLRKFNKITPVSAISGKD